MESPPARALGALPAKLREAWRYCLRCVKSGGLEPAELRAEEFDAFVLKKGGKEAKLVALALRYGYAVRLVAKLRGSAPEVLLWRDSTPPNARFVGVINSWKGRFMLGDVAALLYEADLELASNFAIVAQLRCSFRSYSARHSTKPPPVYLPERSDYVDALRSTLLVLGERLRSAETRLDADRAVKEWSDTKEASELRGRLSAELPKTWSSLKSIASAPLEQAFLKYVYDNKNTVQKPASAPESGKKSTQRLWTPDTCAPVPVKGADAVKTLAEQLQNAQKALLRYFSFAKGEQRSLTRLVDELEEFSLYSRKSFCAVLDAQLSKSLAKLKLCEWFTATLLPAVHVRHLQRCFAQLEGQDFAGSRVADSEYMAHLELMQASARRVDVIVLRPLFGLLQRLEAECAAKANTQLSLLLKEWRGIHRARVTRSESVSSKEEDDKQQVGAIEHVLRDTILHEPSFERCRSLLACTSSYAALRLLVRLTVVAASDALETNKDKTYTPPNEREFDQWKELHLDRSSEKFQLTSGSATIDSKEIEQLSRLVYYPSGTNETETVTDPTRADEQPIVGHQEAEKNWQAVRNAALALGNHIQRLTGYPARREFLETMLLGDASLLYAVKGGKAGPRKEDPATNAIIDLRALVVAAQRSE